MKKWMTILASLLLLSGCGAKEDTFSLSAAEQESYEESIDKVTEDFYWEYDHSSLSFGAAVVPEATEENERLFDASSACEYNLKGKADRMPYWRRRRCCTITAMRQGHCNAGL